MFVRGGLVFSPPKRGKTRLVPLPNSIEKGIKRHIEEYGTPSVTLPRKDPIEGEPVTVKLLATNNNGGAVTRQVSTLTSGNPQ
jgi:hypothetical protein